MSKKLIKDKIPTKFKTALPLFQKTLLRFKFSVLFSVVKPCLSHMVITHISTASSSVAPEEWLSAKGEQTPRYMGFAPKMLHSWNWKQYPLANKRNLSLFYYHNNHLLSIYYVTHYLWASQNLRNKVISILFFFFFCQYHIICKQ